MIILQDSNAIIITDDYDSAIDPKYCIYYISFQVIKGLLWDPKSPKVAQNRPKSPKVA